MTMDDRRQPSDQADLRLERALRGTLAGRDPGTAPARLREGLLRDPAPGTAAVEGEPVAGRVRGARVASGIGVGVGPAALALAAVVALAVGLATVTTSAPGDGHGGAPPTAPPGTEGDIPWPGVTLGAGGFPWWLVIAGLGIAAIAGLLLAARRPRVSTRWARAAALLVGASLVAGYQLLVTWTPLEYGPVSGLGPEVLRVVEPDPASDGVPVNYYPWSAGGHIHVVVSVRNAGPVPIRILGIGDERSDALWRLTGLELRRNMTTLDTIPFVPTELEPGAMIEGRAEATFSTCEPGSTMRAGPGEDGVMQLTLVSMPVRYEVLGLARQASISLPYAMVAEATGSCILSEPADGSAPSP